MPEIKLKTADYETEVVKSELPVLIDFYADWCGPCQMLAPVVAGIAAEMPDRLKVCKVNVDEEPELAAAFSVDSIPMLALTVKGECVAKKVGYCRREDILAMIGEKAGQ